MNLTEFLNLITPKSGVKCLALLRDGKFVHKFFPESSDLALEALNFDENDTVFYAMSSFKTSKNRRGENVQATKALWLDIDCGDNKPYKTQQEGIAAVVKFCSQTKLPVPLIVDSGNGLHCYWPFEEEQTSKIWKDLAQKFKLLTNHFKLEADPSRTSDIASVLRPVGTTHKKQVPHKPVRTINDVSASSFSKLSTIINSLCQDLNMSVPTYIKHTEGFQVNKDLSSMGSYPSPSAHIIADNCPQIAKIRDTRGVVTEPVWYAGIGLLRFTKEAPQITHDWSCGHTGYSKEATDAKIAQSERSTSGASRCATFEGCNPSGCEGCKHRGKINSPISLGREIKKGPVTTPLADTSFLPPPSTSTLAQTTEIDDSGIPAPFRYTRTVDGLYFDTQKEEISDAESGDMRETTFEERNTKFYSFDLFVTNIHHDEHVEGETFIIRHWIPNGGWQEFSIESELLASPGMFYQCLLKHHVKVRVQHVERMMRYVMSYLQDLQKVQRIQDLFMSMGWSRGEDSFTLGTKVITPTEVLKGAELSLGIKDSFCQHFTQHGELEKWTEATKLLNKPGMEGHAFALLLGFGAPLMPFTGYAGALVNLVGQSNTGKTSMTHWLTSIYGLFSELKAQKGDTVNSMFQRLGVFNNLPFIIDEITNIEGMDLSNFVYTITQGRTKTRLRQDASERKNVLRWNTVVVSSSNERLVNKLNYIKADPKAEQLRMFEYEIKRQQVFEEGATQLIETLTDNYGHAGYKYIQYLVRHKDSIKKNLDATRDVLMKASNARPDERYWYAIVSTAIYGGKIAEACGLININVDAVAQHMMKTIQDMRTTLDNKRLDFVTLLGTYLNEFVQNRIVLNKYQSGKGNAWDVMNTPHGALYMRIEKRQDANYLYMDRQHLGRWLYDKKMDIDHFEDALLKDKIIINARKKKVLGGNWPDNPASSSVLTWEVDLDHPALGNSAVRLVEANRGLTQVKAK